LRVRGLPPDAERVSQWQVAEEEREPGQVRAQECWMLEQRPWSEIPKGQEACPGFSMTGMEQEQRRVRVPAQVPREAEKPTGRGDRFWRKRCLSASTCQ